MEETDDAADLLTLRRSSLTSFDQSPAAYEGAVFDALEDLDVDLFDVTSTPFGAFARARAFWFAEGSPARVEWHETDGWTMHGLACGEPVRAPLGILAAPQTVAAWIVDLFEGRPLPGPAADERPPTCRDQPDRADVAFERELLSYWSGIERELIPRPVPAPPSPRAGLAWNAPLKHRCLSCPAGKGHSPWTKQAATLYAKVAMSGRTQTAYTGWCGTCHPDQLHMLSAEVARLDAKLVKAHEHGRFPGTLLLSAISEKCVCSNCLEPWWLFPGASLPLTHGVLDDIGFKLHPCPWCWAADEAGARAAQEHALTHAW